MAARGYDVDFNQDLDLTTAAGFVFLGLTGLIALIACVTRLFGEWVNSRANEFPGSIHFSSVSFTTETRTETMTSLNVRWFDVFSRFSLWV